MGLAFLKFLSCSLQKFVLAAVSYFAPTVGGGQAPEDPMWPEEGPGRHHLRTGPSQPRLVPVFATVQMLLEWSAAESEFSPQEDREPALAGSLVTEDAPLGVWSDTLGALASSWGHLRKTSKLGRSRLIALKSKAHICSGLPSGRKHVLCEWEPGRWEAVSQKERSSQTVRYFTAYHHGLCSFLSQAAAFAERAGNWHLCPVCTYMGLQWPGHWVWHMVQGSSCQNVDQA